MTADVDNMKKPMRYGLAVILWMLVLGSSFYNLPNYPTMWWDEGIFCETAANLAQHGRYALTLQSPDKLKDFDNRISVGPVVIAPVALAFKIFGVEVQTARMVAALFLVATLFFLYLAARLLVGAGAALLAVGLSVACTDLLYWGRCVLGDIPALGCFLAGTYFFLKGFQQERLGFFLLGGLGLGLACAAKEFYAFTVAVPLVVTTLTYWGDRRRQVRVGAVLALGALIPPTAYVALKAVVLKSLTGAVLHFIYQKQLLCHEFFTPFTIGRIYPESWAYLLTHPLFLAGCWGAWRLRRTLRTTPGGQYWAINFGLWSLFYLLAVYWQRFALPALLLASPLAAAVLVQAARRLAAAASPRHRLWVQGAALASLVIFLFPFPLVDTLGNIVCRTQDSPYRLEEYLHRNVPRTVLIETPEYELPFLDDEHRFHLLPEYYFQEATSDSITLYNPNPQAYDFVAVNADMLILGSFGKSVFRQIYPQDKVDRYYSKIATIDFYDIYLRKK